MLDVTALILEDHAQLRNRFAALDDAKGPKALEALWQDLANFLDIHATCEEEVFYPHLLKADTDDGEDETEDAIGDHDKIRDAIREAARHQVGTKAWFDAVGDAREENSEHLAEEEDGALADFRKNATEALREELAVEWRAWRTEHQPLKNVDTRGKDPETYIKENS